MKLRNKKTGELGYFCFANWDSPTIIIMDNNGIQLAKYNSFAELNEDWEDYEEPKEYWYIDMGSIVEHTYKQFELTDKERKEIGNYFLSEEEAEKAVEKLKAVKRLKDKGFNFDGWENDQSRTLGDFIIYASIKCLDDIVDDLNLLFGGEK